MIKIRRFRPSDVNDGFNEVLSQLSETDLERYEASNLHDIRRKQKILTEVATDHGHVVGTASLIVEQKLSHGGAISGHIEDVAVDRDYRKMGIGKLLIDKMLQLARQHNCYKVSLHCDPEVSGFYGKCGFYLNGIAMRIDL